MHIDLAKTNGFFAFIHFYSSYYKVVVIIGPLQDLYAILLVSLSFYFSHFSIVTTLQIKPLFSLCIYYIAKNNCCQFRSLLWCASHFFRANAFYSPSFSWDRRSSIPIRAASPGFSDMRRRFFWLLPDRALCNCRIPLLTRRIRAPRRSRFTEACPSQGGAPSRPQRRA